jgi:hypothetical protein
LDAEHEAKLVPAMRARYKVLNWRIVSSVMRFPVWEGRRIHGKHNWGNVYPFVLAEVSTLGSTDEAELSGAWADEAVLIG